MLAAEEPVDRHVSDAGGFGEMRWKPALLREIGSEQIHVVGRAPVVRVRHCKTETTRCCPALSTTIFSGVPQCAPRQQYDGGDVAGKRSYDSALGKFWKDLRTDRKLGLREAASIAARRALPQFTKAVIENLEKGTKSPKPETVRSASIVYDCDYAWLVSEISRVKFAGTPSPEPPPRAHTSAADAAFIEAISGPNARRIWKALVQLPDESIAALVPATELIARLHGSRSGSALSSATAPEPNQVVAGTRARGRRRHP